MACFGGSLRLGGHLKKNDVNTTGTTGEFFVFVNGGKGGVKRDSIYPPSI